MVVMAEECNTERDDDAPRGPLWRVGHAGNLLQGHPTGRATDVIDAACESRVPATAAPSGIVAAGSSLPERVGLAHGPARAGSRHPVEVDSESKGGSTLATERTPSIGRIAWVDLTVGDAELIGDVYAKVTDSRPAPVDMGDYADYTMLDAAGGPAAGVCHARGPNADLPPQWMIYNHRCGSRSRAGGLRGRWRRRGRPGAGTRRDGTARCDP